MLEFYNGRYWGCVCDDLFYSTYKADSYNADYICRRIFLKNGLSSFTSKNLLCGWGLIKECAYFSNKWNGYGSRCYNKLRCDWSNGCTDEMITNDYCD